MPSTTPHDQPPRWAAYDMPREVATSQRADDQRHGISRARRVGRGHLHRDDGFDQAPSRAAAHAVPLGWSECVVVRGPRPTVPHTRAARRDVSSTHRRSARSSTGRPRSR